MYLRNKRAQWAAWTSKLRMLGQIATVVYESSFVISLSGAILYLVIEVGNIVYLPGEVRG